jgi:hypothetical protein
MVCKPLLMMEKKEKKRFPEIFEGFGNGNAKVR